MKELTEIGSSGWVHFEDCLQSEAGRANSFAVIAEVDDFKSARVGPFIERRYTLSHLAPSKKETVDKILETDSWDVQYDLGDVGIEKLDEGIICCEYLGNEEARVFITLKESVGDFQNTWKLWPTFENYFNLRYDDDGNLVDPYSGELIAEIPFPAERGPVRIRTDYLQDYLAARNMVLIRQHDYSRSWKDYITDLPETEGSGSNVRRERWGCYTLYLSNSKISSDERYSRLVFKDLISPYNRAGIVGYRKQVVDPQDYPDFIIDTNNGKEIKKKPSPNDLIPVYFNPKVLKKYYDEPARYSVGFHAPGVGGVSFLNKWSFTIGRNDEGLIVVWLGDLVKQGLSYEEINHWRAHNVAPRGGMAVEFREVQLQNDPPKEPSLECKLIECKYHLIQYFDSLGKKIYNSYIGPDIHIEKTLREPLYDEHPEFQETLILLSKMFIEYLDIESIKNDLPDERKKGTDGKDLTNLVLFGNWLEFVINVPSKLAGNVKKSLQNIQMVRSKTGVAHRFSDNSYQEAMKKLGLTNKSFNGKLLFDSVAEPLANNLEELCITLGIRDKLWWIRLAKDEKI